MDRISKWKINKETKTLNGILDQMDLADIFRTFHPKTEEYKLFSSAYKTFSRIGHILGHKTSLNKLKKNIEVTPCIFSDHKHYETRNQLQEKSWIAHKKHGV